MRALFRENPSAPKEGCCSLISCSRPRPQREDGQRLCLLLVSSAVLLLDEPGMPRSKRATRSLAVRKTPSGEGAGRGLSNRQPSPVKARRCRSPGERGPAHRRVGAIRKGRSPIRAARAPFLQRHSDTINEFNPWTSPWRTGTQASSPTWRRRYPRLFTRSQARDRRPDDETGLAKPPFPNPKQSGDRVALRWPPLAADGKDDPQQ
jgi:hypothetical protein